MALDAAQIALIACSSQLPLKLRGGDFALSGDPVQQLNGQMHRFHAFPVVRHSFLHGVFAHLFVLDDVFCRAYPILLPASSRDNCING